MKKSGRERENRPYPARGASGPPHPRSSNPLTGVELDEGEQRAIEGGEKPRFRPVAIQPVAKKKYTVGQLLLLIMLGGLLLGTVALIVLNLFFPNWPHRKTLPPPSSSAVLKSPPAAPAAPTLPPPQQATSPVEAVRLMLRASVKGDTRTAYAQWDIHPEDIATIERGVQITLAEQTEELASPGNKVNLEEYRYRLSQQSPTEALVSQYHGDVLTQIYSLRRVGSYWKLYNAQGPDR